MTHTITLDTIDAAALAALAVAFPGITLHLAHLAVFRLGLARATSEPTLLAGELVTISEERRERRRLARPARSEARVSGREGGSNG